MTAVQASEPATNRPTDSTFDSVLALGHDLDADIDLGIHAEHEDARRFHPEVAHIECRPTREPHRVLVEHRHRHLLLAGPGLTPKGHLARDEIAVVADEAHRGQLTIDRREAA